MSFLLYQYPAEIRKYEYDPNFAIRGLHYDVQRVSLSSCFSEVSWCLEIKCSSTKPLALSLGNGLERSSVRLQNQIVQMYLVGPVGRGLRKASYCLGAPADAGDAGGGASCRIVSLFFYSCTISLKSTSVNKAFGNCVPVVLNLWVVTPSESNDFFTGSPKTIREH